MDCTVHLLHATDSSEARGVRFEEWARARRSQFQDAGTFVLHAQESICEALESVFMFTQHVDLPWPSPECRDYAARHLGVRCVDVPAEVRSTAVGDLLVLAPHQPDAGAYTYRVNRFGFAFVDADRHPDGDFYHATIIMAPSAPSSATA